MDVASAMCQFAGSGCVHHVNGLGGFTESLRWVLVLYNKNRIPMAATPINTRKPPATFGQYKCPPCEPAPQPSLADLVLRHSGKKPAVQWFYSTVPLHEEMTPGIAKATDRMLRSALSPKEGAASPATCMEALESIEGTLKLRRSERIKKAVAVAKAKAEAEQAACEAAKTRAGQKRRAFRARVGSRGPKFARFVVDNALRRSAF